MEIQTDESVCISFIQLMFFASPNGDMYPHTFVKWDAFFRPDTPLDEVISDGLARMNTETLRLLEICGIPTIWSFSRSTFAKLNMRDGEGVITQITDGSDVMLTNLVDRVLFFLPSRNHWDTLTTLWHDAHNTSILIASVRDSFFRPSEPALSTRDMLCVAKRGCTILRQVPWGVGLELHSGFSHRLHRRVFFDNVLFQYYAVEDTLYFEKQQSYDFPESISDVVYNGSSDDDSRGSIADSHNGQGGDEETDSSEGDEPPLLDPPTPLTGTTYISDRMDIDTDSDNGNDPPRF